MREIGGFEFPENKEEAENWEHFVLTRALAQHVLCVAHTRVEGMWSAYCDAVPGYNHDNEYQEVLDHGDKLPVRIAEAIFPQFKGIPYAH